ncbi:MAG: 50S ribosomal protein L2 [Candidatus Jordarchaeum sp.]|uniref:50S ribosomal protein L2 n=1 Tax=Candidatus Jordarchaeum sp. TaxID=2823881 RepID=UPI00404A106F
MGKRILVQRRGRGGSNFRAPSHKRKGKIKHCSIKKDKEVIYGTIIELTHEPGRGAPLAKVRFEDGGEQLILVPEGAFIGQKIGYGSKAVLKLGNTLPLREIPEGTPIFNLEGTPGDGGKFVRSSGAYATVLSHSADKSMVRLPSNKIKAFNPNCNATIGVVAGGGRTDKPFIKAGNVYHLSKAKSWKWPKVRGVAMNAASHPHGGGSHQHVGGPSTVSRNAPPGQKVGLIAARRAGRKKGKK